MGKLNVLSVKNAKPGRHGDGGGLYLLVKPTGARSWLLRVRVRVGDHSRRRDIGLGSIAKLTLAEAREEAAKLLKHALNGRDPIAERDRRAFVPKTFREAAVATHAAKAEGWAIKTADAFLTSMEEHAYPVLGDLLVEHIDASDIARALKPIWTDKPAMAVKVRHRIGAVLSFSKASKWRTTDAPMRELGHLLSRQEAGGAMASMPYGDVPAFMASLEALAPSSGRQALLFAIVTAARSGEVRKARWEQIDFDNRLWNRPADIMKGKVAHSVTLSEYAIGLLHRARGDRAAPTGFVFASRSGTAPLSDMTLSKIMRDAELPYVPHGFRSSFRDWAAELMPTIPEAVAEAALAHTIPDKVVRAYKRTQLIELRRQLLEAWGIFLAGRSNVLPLWGASGTQKV
jgi:integrase